MIYCSNPLSAQVTGNWQSPFDGGYTMKLDLNADGTGKLDGAPITYKIANGKITIMESGSVSNVYNYSIQGNKLQLAGGDLSAPITFTKESRGGLSEKINQQKKQTAETKTEANPAKTPTGIVGTWTGNTGKFIFYEDGTGTGNGSQMKYSLNGNAITMSDNTGTYTLNYTITGNTLTMTGSGGSITFTRGDVNTSAGNNNTGGNSQQLVGKWCYLTSNYNSLYNASNSSFTNECFTLKDDGTYTYSFESNRSTNTPGVYGYSNNSDSDQGTWSYDGGNKLTVNSAKSGTKIYTIEKKNHPKNKDPMIFIEGRGYVTYFNKTPW